MPPHLRKLGAAAPPEARSLDELAPSHLSIQLHYAPGAVPDGWLSSCPDELTTASDAPGAAAATAAAAAARPADGRGDDDPGSAGLAVLNSPACPDTYMIEQLLEWFKGAGSDAHAMLSLPASLSKQERAVWHKAAERLHLHSQSEVGGRGKESRAPWTH